jgi:hypothetical protein
MSFTSRSVDVRAELLYQTTYRSQMSVPGGAKQGRGSIVRCVVDVRTELLDQQSHDIKVAIISGDVQGCLY